MGLHSTVYQSISLCYRANRHIWNGRSCRHAERVAPTRDHRAGCRRWTLRGASGRNNSAIASGNEKTDYHFASRGSGRRLVSLGRYRCAASLPLCAAERSYWRLGASVIRLTDYLATRTVTNGWNRQRAGIERCDAALEHSERKVEQRAAAAAAKHKRSRRCQNRFSLRVGTRFWNLGLSPSVNRCADNGTLHASARTPYRLVWSARSSSLRATTCIAFLIFVAACFTPGIHHVHCAVHFLHAARFTLHFLFGAFTGIF